MTLRMRFFCLLISFSLLLSLQTDKYQSMRLAMVNDQIVKRGIRNPLIIKAMEKVPRHLFVPTE